MIDVAKRIKEVIKDKGLSLYELAVTADMSESTVYAWYKDGAVPSLWNIKKVCDAVGITLEHFFCGDKYVDEESELLMKRSLLTDSEKELVLNLMKAINRHNC